MKPKSETSFREWIKDMIAFNWMLMCLLSSETSFKDLESKLKSVNVWDCEQTSEELRRESCLKWAMLSLKTRSWSRWRSARFVSLVLTCAMLSNKIRSWSRAGICESCLKSAMPSHKTRSWSSVVICALLCSNKWRQKLRGTTCKPVKLWTSKQTNRQIRESDQFQRVNWDL